MYMTNQVAPRKLSNPSVLANSSIAAPLGQPQLSTAASTIAGHSGTPASQTSVAAVANNINKNFGAAQLPTAAGTVGGNAGRGVPPPIPPNKPVIPPKREPSATRLLATGAANAAAAMISNSPNSNAVSTATGGQVMNSVSAKNKAPNKPVDNCVAVEDSQ